MSHKLSELNKLRKHNKPNSKNSKKMEPNNPNNIDPNNNANAAITADQGELINSKETTPDELTNAPEQYSGEMQSSGIAVDFPAQPHEPEETQQRFVEEQPTTMSEIQAEPIPEEPPITEAPEEPLAEAPTEPTVPQPAKKGSGTVLWIIAIILLVVSVICVIVAINKSRN